MTPHHRAAPYARRRSEQGASSVEYAILASLIAAVIALTVGGLGLLTLDLFTRLEFP